MRYSEYSEDSAQKVSYLAELNRDHGLRVVHQLLSGAAMARDYAIYTVNTRPLGPRIAFLGGGADPALPFNLNSSSENVHNISFLDSIITKIFNVTVDIV